MDEVAFIAQPYVDLYENLFRQANPGGLPVIGAADAANFLKKSGLDVQTLGQIWEIADYQKRGVLDKRGFYMAFKLVSAVQQGHPVAPSSLQLTNLGPPQFGPASSQPSPQITQQQINWGISQADQNKYDSIFDSLGPENGKIPGAKVRPVLMNSGLNPTSLARIWELADQDKDGCLDRIEMAVALHLVYSALQNEPLPSVLPNSLIHPTKAHLSRRSSTASGHPSTYPPLSNAARSRTGSVASLDGIGLTASPQGPSNNRSVSAQPYVDRNGSMSRASLTTPCDEWPVDRLSFVAKFAACDSDSDGLVSGMDVRPVLIATGLPQQILAKIWELADINRNGTLNQEQFALIMHLVNLCKEGQELPSNLPKQLIPPSLRKPTCENGLSASLSSAALSENPEVRQLAEEMEKLLTDRREADAQVAQLEADMTVKNSAIKNLQVELHALESTVKQLERQKAEAGKRLGDLDEQIRQLVAVGQSQQAKTTEAQERLTQLHSDAQNGEVSANNDRQLISEAISESDRFEAEARQLAAALAAEEKAFEQKVTAASMAESQIERDASLLPFLAEETAKVQKAMNELQTCLGSENASEKIQQQMHLLSNMEKPRLMTPSNGMTPSTSAASASGFTGDAFSSDRAAPSHDPFQNADPFAGATNAFGQSSGVPSDPFASNQKIGPPPPRPAPPKSSARETPVNEDPFANVDPFGPAATQNGANSGFADFANFGAFG